MACEKLRASRKMTFDSTSSGIPCQIHSNCYGDGNIYRGQRSKDSSVKTIFITADDKELISLLRKSLRTTRDGRCGDFSISIKSGTYTVTHPSGHTLTIKPGQRGYVWDFLRDMLDGCCGDG